MNDLSMRNDSSNTSLPSDSSDLHTEMSFYALIYGLGAVAIVLAISLRGIIFMTVRSSCW